MSLRESGRERRDEIDRWIHRERESEVGKLIVTFAKTSVISSMSSETE